jgi:poly(3-hydroxyalkanoate) synthetase
LSPRKKRDRPVKLWVNVPRVMFLRIERAALLDLRSRNSEIVHLLKSGLGAWLISNGFLHWRDDQAPMSQNGDTL